MEKAFSLLLALVMCLSLCACGGGNDASQATEPQYTTVDITIDNWTEYFELTPENFTFTENSFGEVDGAEVKIYLMTKDGIVCDADNCAIAIEYEYTWVYTPFVIDYENETISYGDPTSNPATQNTDTKMYKIGKGFGCTPLSYPVGALEGEVFPKLLSVDVIRIEGTLSFYQEN